MTDAASCPRCGYTTLTLVAGNTMLCDRPGCGYEHLVTTTMPIIVVTQQDAD